MIERKDILLPEAELMVVAMNHFNKNAHIPLNTAAALRNVA
jgi:hypothetical protein